MIEFQEYTGWKVEKAKRERRENIINALKLTGLTVVCGLTMYGMMWLGCFLDYIHGV